MEVKATQKHIRMATRKVRLVCALIRGLDVEDARHTLRFTRKAIAPEIQKLLQSVVANATNNNKLEKANLFVKEVLVNQGPTMKRVMPRSQGRAYRILKRSSHVTIVLGEKVASQKKELATKKVEQAVKSPEPTINSEAKAKKSSSSRKPTTKRSPEGKST